MPAAVRRSVGRSLGRYWGIEQPARRRGGGEKLTWGSVEGDYRLRGVETIDPKKVTGRSDGRHAGVEITRGKEFFVEPDGRIYRSPRCRSISGISPA